jgi:PAS domain S-box-containing protein
MNMGYSFVDRLVSPDKPRSMGMRVASGILLPLAAVASMHALFPFDASPFIPLLMLSIVCAALFGGVRAGIVATLMSMLCNVLAFRPRISIQNLSAEVLFHMAIFLVVASIISLVAGSVGALIRRVEAERRRLAVTLSCIGDAVVSTDLEGRVIFMNPAAEKATGWTLERAYGKPPESMFRIVDQKTRTIVENPIRIALETGASGSPAAQTGLVRPDGTEIRIKDSAAPIRDAQSKVIGAVMVFRDVTVDAEHETAWTQTQRLASVGRLAATVAHEINNPLQAATNLLFLVSHGDDLEAAQAHAREATEELRRASEITKQTLSFSRGAGEVESLPLDQLFDDVMSLYRNKLKNKNVEVVKDHWPDTFMAARRGQVRQVLGNLIGNALDALAQDGRLYLRSRLTTYANAPAVCLVVADNGSGIAKDHMSRILEPFFTTKEDVGTGLGLWVVDKAVEGVKGTLKIRSRSGSGTVVRIVWPLPLAYAEPVETASAAELRESLVPFPPAVERQYMAFAPALAVGMD